MEKRFYTCVLAAGSPSNIDRFLLNSRSRHTTSVRCPQTCDLRLPFPSNDKLIALNAMATPLGHFWAIKRQYEGETEGWFPNSQTSLDLLSPTSTGVKSVSFPTNFIEFRCLALDFCGDSQTIGRA